MNAAVQADSSILFPVARLVQGDLYKAQDKDNQGNPLTIKTGPNAGKARVNFFFAIAVPKSPGVTHWGNEQTWGARIWALGHSWWPQGQAQQDRFAWKIEDGDDTRPNQNNRRNCDREGFPGHWIIQLGSSFAPKIFDEQGNPLLQENLIKRGFWVEVLANVQSNENAQNPGIYINHSMVAYRAPGKEIVSGPDPKAVGFGRSALPVGVTAQPVGNVAHIPAAAPAVPGAAPAVPGAPPVPGAAPVYAAPPPAAPAPVVAAPVPVQPAQSFLQPPVAGAAPPVPAAPAMAAPVVAAPPPTVVCPLGAPMGYKMANLNGPRYDAYKAQGWNDAQLLQAAHMVRL
jgi:hypothetical protein